MEVPKPLLGVLCLCALAVHGPAWALDCDQITAMLDAGVPAEVVASAVRGSGDVYRADAVDCLAAAGVPIEVLVEVRRRLVVPEAVVDPEVRATAVVTTGSTEPIDRLIRLVRAGKNLTASKELFELLQSGAYPSEESRLRYYLAKALLGRGFELSAAHHLLAVVRRGPEDPYFRYATPKLIALTERTGFDADLVRVANRIPASMYPKKARDHLHYLAGRKLLDDGALTLAKESFAQVSERSPVYPRARYLEGEIQRQTGNLRSAVQAFEDVVESDAPVLGQAQAHNLEDLQALAVLAIARIYYGAGQYDRAAELYRKVPRTNPYWADSLFERAWAEYRTNALDRSMGSLLTLEAPYFRDNAFLPEGRLVEALDLYSVCQWSSVAEAIEAFEATYRPMRDELRGVLAAHRGRDGAWLGAEAFREVFVDGLGETALPKGFFTRVLRSRDLAGAVRHLDALDAEIVRLNQQKAMWRDTVGAYQVALLQRDRQRVESRAGLALLRELDRQQRGLSDLLSDAQVLRFEVVDGERREATERLLQQDGLRYEAPRVEVSYGHSSQAVMWPFNGEFWEDELGYYQVYLQNRCGEADPAG